MFYPARSMSDPVALQSAQEAASEARRAATKADQVHFDIERLLMITEALWTILKEKYGLDDTELQRRVAEIDMRDGKLDGKLARSAPVKCTHCGKSLMKRRPRCIYCGHPAPPSLFER